MRSPLFQLLLRCLILAVGVLLATKLVPGIKCDDGGTLIAVVFLLTVFNAILKPLMVIFTLPFILLTLGLGVIVINALLFLFVGRLVDGFHVAGFWSAVGGSLVVSFTNLFVSAMMKTSAKPPKPPRRDDAIDI